jgi:hypothetical protein
LPFEEEKAKIACPDCIFIDYTNKFNEIDLRYGSGRKAAPHKFILNPTGTKVTGNDNSLLGEFMYKDKYLTQLWLVSKPTKATANKAPI